MDHIGGLEGDLRAHDQPKQGGRMHRPDDAIQGGDDRVRTSCERHVAGGHKHPRRISPRSRVAATLRVIQGVGHVIDVFDDLRMDAVSTGPLRPRSNRGPDLDFHEPAGERGIEDVYLIALSPPVNTGHG